MKHNQYDDILREGLIRYKQLEFANVPPEDEINHIFSEKFNKAKTKLLRSIDRPLWKYTNTVAKRAAVILVCLVLAAASLLTVDAVRKKVVDFIYEIFDTHTLIEYKVEQNLKIEKYYMLPNVPAAFSQISKVINQTTTLFFFESESNQTIAFTQTTKDGIQRLNSENSQIVETIINNTPCIVVQQQNIYIYYWEFDGYAFTLTYSTVLGEEYAQSVIGKLIEIDI